MEGCLRNRIGYDECAETASGNEDRTLTPNKSDVQSGAFAHVTRNMPG